MRRARPILVVLLGVAVFAALLLAPQSATATTTQCGATAVADAYVKQNGATSNFGTADPLEVQGTATQARWSYLKFACALPAGEAFTSATLRVRFSKVQAQPVEIHAAPSTWTESGITWTNKPATTGPLTSRTVATGFIDFAVTGIVDGDNTLVLKAPTSTGNYQFRSRSYGTVGDRPTLTVVTSPAPTTTTAPPTTSEPTTTTEAPTTTAGPTTTTSPPPPPPGLLDQRLKGTEVGAWNSAVSAGTSDAVSAKVVAANTDYTRVAPRDCFIGEVCGSDNHPGTLNRDQYKNMVAAVVSKHQAHIWLKMLPIARDALDNGPAGTVFCEPWTGASTLNLPTYLSVLNATAEAIPAAQRADVSLILELNNERDFTCTGGTSGPWDVQSGQALGGGSVGVAKRIGELYAGYAPTVFPHARSLGFREVIKGDYIGIGGGTGWNANACAPDASAPYGYVCPKPGFTWASAGQARWVTEWNTAVHDAYAASPSPDLIPDYEAIHQYWHGPDFGTNPYAFADGLIYAYNRAWIQESRAIVNSIWGASIGNQIRFAISEGNAGVSRSSDAWSGWSTPSMVESFYTGVLQNLKGDGVTTGSGTAYWAWTVFCAACNGSAPGNKYDIVLPDGSVPAWYDEWASFTP